MTKMGTNIFKIFVCSGCTDMKLSNFIVRNSSLRSEVANFFNKRFNQKLHHVKCYDGKRIQKFYFFLRLWLQNMVYGLDFRKEIEILVQTFWLSIIVFQMMKILAIFQDKAGKPMIEEPYRDST